MPGLDARQRVRFDPPMTATQDNRKSSYREILIEHLFVGEMMRRLWLRRITEFEVLHSQVDDAGYDIVFAANLVTRHIQLKSSFRGARTGQSCASLKLLRQPSACVIWIQFDPQTMELGPFLWFGSSAGEPMPDITPFRVARHVRANAKGVKKERPNQRSIPRTKFVALESCEVQVTRLFGDHPEGGAPLERFGDSKR